CVAEDAGTRQKSTDVQSGPGELVDHNPDDTVITKTIRDGDGENLRLLLLMEFHDFHFTSATSGEIELVGSLGELRHARELGGSGLFDLNLQVQSGEEVGETQRLRLKLLALAILQIERGALAIFFGDFEMIENPEVAEKPLHRGEVLWKLNGNDSPSIGFDFGARERVTIDPAE